LILLRKIQEHKKKKTSDKSRNLIGNFYINDFRLLGFIYNF